MRRIRFWNRFHARIAARARPATAFVTSPEPRTIGLFAKGRQLLAGNLLFAGHLSETKGTSIWDFETENTLVQEEVHGCQWLDDLAAVGDYRARHLGQEWVQDWIARFGRGVGPGWTPDLTGRRLIRLINHGLFLLRGLESDASERFFRSLGRQTIFLSRRWKTAAPGLARFEALSGLIYAGLALEGMERHVDPAIKALAKDCQNEIDGAGGIRTRNPEELLEVFSLLNWVVLALKEVERPIPAEVRSALERIAPTLRALRHSDGSLARFHGGGRGVEGRLDAALAGSGIRTHPGEGLHMGFARLNAGRSSLILDGAAPPSAAASINGHASTLGFELSSGRRPLIVNCGSGRSFGTKWRRAGRATPSHSTLCIEGYSSTRLAAPSRILGTVLDQLEDPPSDVFCETSDLEDAKRIELSHNGYQLTHGLTHARIFDLANDGRGLIGEDLMTTLNDEDEERFAKALQLSGAKGIPFSVRFHLHPDVDAILDLGGAAVSMALKSGEIWVFRHDGSAELSLEPSVYLENGRLKPRVAKQMVLSGHAMAYATRVRWSLAKAQDTPDVIRDLAPPEDFAQDE